MPTYKSDIRNSDISQNFDSFLTSDLKNRHVSRLFLTHLQGMTEGMTEGMLKINVKHVGFLNQMSEMNQNEENVST